MQTGKLFLIIAFCVSIQLCAAQYGHITSHVAKLHGAGNRVQKINPFDSLHIWVLAHVDNGDLLPEHRNTNAELVYSSNSGINWQVKAIAGTAPADSFAVGNIWPVSASTCFMGMYNFATSKGGKILKTSNAGQTWQNITAASGMFDDGFLNLVYFFTPDTGIAAGDPQAGYFEIYTTANAGQTWNRIDSALLPMPLNGETGMVDRFTYAGDAIYMHTNKGRTLYSADKGATWQIKNTSYATGINLLAQINNANDMLAPANSQQYYYSKNLGLSKTTLSFPPLQGGIYGAPFRTKSDNTFLSVAYHIDSANIIDSQYVYMCVDSPGVATNWKRALGISCYEYGLEDDMLARRHYFYNKNLGWIAGYWTVEHPAGTTHQAILRYANCAAPPVTLNMPETMCNNDVLALEGLATPPGGNFFANLFSDTITQFVPADFNLADSLFYIQYVFGNAAGCYSEDIDPAFVQACTGVNDVTRLALKVYPNPASDVLYISQPIPGVAITITDETGRNVLTANSATLINISALADGFYFLRMQGETINWQTRFVKR